ncbi:MAG: DEAD/DEAH box helicase, partial [Halanaerobiales bacterium]
MLILDLNDNEQLVAEISGNNFHDDLNKIKNIPGAEYDSENKFWILPKTINIVNKLDNDFIVAMKKNKYQLSGTQEPYVKTGADVFLKDYKTVSKYIKRFGIKDLYRKLHNFQKLGVGTILYHMENGGGFLLSDDMGLGKTVQALSVIYALKNTGKINKTIVSCPKNVKYQWGHEIEKFTNLTPVVVDGYKKSKRLECYNKPGDVYIINHDQLILNDDFKLLQKLNADMIIADEVHYFKNRDTQRTQAIKKLSKNFKYKLGLSGTPLQNKPSDTYSIFEFLIPGYLRDWNDFTKYYIVWTYYRGRSYPAGFRNLFELKKKISKKMLRRLADDVSDELPIVKAKNHIVPMDITQIRLHNEIEEIIEQKQEEIDEERQAGNNNQADEMDDSIM